MKKLPYLIFFILILVAIFFGYQKFIVKNLSISSNIEGAQVRYRVLDDEFTSSVKELYNSKAYTVLGNTPLDVNLEPGRYVIIVAKSAHVPVVEELIVGEEAKSKSYHLEEGFRYMKSKSFYYRDKKYNSKGFYLAEKETTNKEYLAFCEATGHRLPIYINDERFNAKDQPVIGINYEDAIAYTKWRSEISGRIVRLPYEYEWMYAATDGDSSRIYPWGVHETTTSSYLANYHPFDVIQRKMLAKDVDGYTYTSPVASYSKTDNKFYDLAGNVFEWCLDTLTISEYPDYNLKSDIDPALEKHSRIVKGGSWNFNQLMLQVKNRIFVDGRIQKGYNGIRLLIEID